MVETGFFVDWDGNTRRTEAPGAGYTCTVDGPNCDVLDEEGCVIHEATYYATLAEIEALGVTVKLV